MPIASGSLPVLKFPVVIGSGSGGTYAVMTEWDGTQLPLSMTLDQTQRYWLTGDGQSGSQVTDLVEAFEARFQSIHAVADNEFRFRLNTTSQRVTVFGSGVRFGIGWSSGTLPRSWFGFTGSFVVASGGSFTGSFPVAGSFIPSRMAASDTYDTPEATVSALRSTWGRQTTYRFDDDQETREIRFMLEPRGNVLTGSAGFPPSGSLEAIHRSSISAGMPVRVYDRRDRVHSSSFSGSSTYSLYDFQDPSASPWEQDTGSSIKPFYTPTFRLRKRKRV